MTPPGEEGRGAEPNQDGPTDGQKGRDDGYVLFVDETIAIVGGLIAAALAFATMYFIGSVGGLEARLILESTMPTIRFLCSTVGTAAATILALMLTLLGLSHNTEYRLRERHYVRIRQISWLASIALLMSIGLLLLLVVPLGEAKHFPNRWFDIVYYVILGLSALLGGVTFMLVVMLLNAVRGVIAVVDRRTEDPGLVVDED